MSDIESILNGSAEAAPVVEAPAPAPVVPPASAEVPPQPEAPAEPAAPAGGRQRDESGRFVPKGEASAEAPAGEGAPPAPKEDAALDHPALIAERRRRQAAENEIARIRAEHSAAPPAGAMPAAPAPTTATAPPDRYEDPEGYDRWLRETVRAEAVAEARGMMEEHRISTSATVARGKYQDFPAMATLFAELAAGNPALEHALRRAEDPGEYAYKTARLHLDLREHGSIEGLIAAREAAAREAARAELAGTSGGLDPANSGARLPESLAGVQSSRASAAAAPARLSLEEILNPSRK